jgi:dimethylargininase
VQRALVRRPSPRLAEGIVTHLDRSPVDLEHAQLQWGAYVAALNAAGWSTVEVPPADDCPDGVFIEDTMIVVGDLAIISRPGAPERRPETIQAASTVAGLGYRIARIETPGTLDGGDVLKVGRNWYVGRSGRTNAAGILALRALVAPMGISVIAVPMTKALHLKSAITALPDGSLIGYPPVLDDPGFFPHFITAPEEPGAHVVDLGDDTLLLAAGAPRTAELLSNRGYRPVVVDISEFEKLEGCVTCLSVRLRG